MKKYRLVPYSISQTPYYKLEKLQTALFGLIKYWIFIEFFKDKKQAEAMINHLSQEEVYL